MLARHSGWLITTIVLMAFFSIAEVRAQDGQPVTNRLGESFQNLQRLPPADGPITVSYEEPLGPGMDSATSEPDPAARLNGSANIFVHQSTDAGTFTTPSLLPSGPDDAGSYLSVAAQEPPRGSSLLRFFREGEWYFSWGYSKQYWAPADIQVNQPGQGNDFTLFDVRGHDEPGWTTGILNKGFMGPQYNLRIGRFINDDRTVAVEFNLDHTKYTTNSGQTAFLSGTIAGAPVSGNYVLDDSFFQYKLHNGANHVMVNGVYRRPLIGQLNESLSIAAIGKVGLGLVVPHSSNVVLGHANDVGKKQLGNYFGKHTGWWQFDGWTAGVEFGLRMVLYKPIFLELTDKLAYAYLSDIPVYQGTASHSLLMNEVVLTVGITYDGFSKYRGR